MTKIAFLTVLIVILALPVTAGSAEVYQTRSPDDFLTKIPKTADFVVLNFWATWCVPCVAELGELAALDRDLDDRIAFVGISLDDAVPDEKAAVLARVEKMLARKKIEYLNVLYFGNPASLTERWGIDEGIPQTIVIDHNGTPVLSISGKIEAGTFRNQLEDLLQKH